MDYTVPLYDSFKTAIRQFQLPLIILSQMVNGSLLTRQGAYLFSFFYPGVFGLFHVLNEYLLFIVGRLNTRELTSCLEGL